MSNATASNTTIPFETDCRKTSRPIIFAPIALYTQEPLNYCIKQSQTINVSGSAVSAPATVIGQFCRVGSMVNIGLPDNMIFTSTGASGTLVLTIAAPWSFPQPFASGTCILIFAGTNYQVNYRMAPITNKIEFSANNEMSQLNSGVGCPVVPIGQTFQIRSFVISLTVA